MIGKYQIENLLVRLRGGDEKSFVIIYDHFWEKLYYVAFQKLQSQEAAEEVVQEVFLTLWNKRQELEIETLQSYLAAMVRYSVYRYYAKEQSLRNRETNYYENQLHERDLGEDINNKLILDKIFELSNVLPEKCRLVFQYNKLEDRSLKEVAKRLNIAPKTAEAHLTKALKIIRLNLRGFLNFFF